MGPGAWVLWLEEYFRGAKRTAKKYMQLARAVPEIETLRGMSLRQAYLHLGIATEPKSRAESPHVEALPSHVRLANKLLATLEQSPPAVCLSHTRVPHASRDLEPQGQHQGRSSVLRPARNTPRHARRPPTNPPLNAVGVPARRSPSNAGENHRPAGSARRR